MTVIDTGSLAVVGRIPLDGSAGRIAVDASDGTVYVAHAGADDDLTPLVSVLRPG